MPTTLEQAKMHVDDRLANDLILDEMFDLTLYRELHKWSQGHTQKILAELIPVEVGHLAFWQDFFHKKLSRLNFRRRMKLRLLSSVCRLFGSTAVHMVLEAIEVYGIRKYLNLHATYKDTPLGQALQQVLEDEFKHEDAIVSQMQERKIDPEKVRSIFLGFNDGSVEILGAVSGFFAAFQNASMVIVAGLTVAVAGAISMAAGAFVAGSAAAEIHRLEWGKKRFLGEAAEAPSGASPLSSAVLVGISYVVGALVPVLPVLLGAHTLIIPLLFAGVMILLVSLVLAFLSGMQMRKRIAVNLVILSAAVGITFLLGTLANRLWGVNV